MNGDNLIPPEKIDEYLNDDNKFKIFVIQTLQDHKIELKAIRQYIKLLFVLFVIAISISIGLKFQDVISILQYVR